MIDDWAKNIRIESLKMMYLCPAGHPGGTLSLAEIIATLYFSEININPEYPAWPKRDRVILSKGHGCVALYSALGLLGYFDVEEFTKFRRIQGLLQGHPSMSIPGVDAPSGSLGMGLSQGLGMALGSRYSRTDFRVYVILGDGDMQEGCTWEAIMAAGHHNMDNLCAILDYNKIQQDGFVEETMNYSPIIEKLEAFNWTVIEVDGHDCNQIQNAFKKARENEGKPFFIIAHTTKGKGVSFMENTSKWHGTVPLSKENFDRALYEIMS